MQTYKSGKPSPLISRNMAESPQSSGAAASGRPYRCRGVVTSVEGKVVGLEVWGEDPDGKRTTVGNALVELV